MNLEIEICGVHVKPLEFDPVEPSIWFTVNGVKLVEWVNVSEDGFTLERVDTYEYYNREEFMELVVFVMKMKINIFLNFCLSSVNTCKKL